MKSRGATIMSDLTKFRSRMTCLLSMQALVATIHSSVLYLTLHWELPEIIFLKKKINAKNICPKIPQKMSNLVSPKTIGIITAVKWTLHNYIYSNKQVTPSNFKLLRNHWYCWWNNIREIQTLKKSLILLRKQYPYVFISKPKVVLKT